MKSVIDLTVPISVKQFKNCDKVLVFDDLVYGGGEEENYVKTYVYDRQNDVAYLKRDLVHLNKNGRGNGCNFSNTKVSLKDVVDSINWHVEKGGRVEAYFDDGR